MLLWLLGLASTILAAALPIFSSPVPVVIWHGLGDRYDASGLQSLKTDLEERPELRGLFVWIVKIVDDGSSDQRATFFGSANQQVSLICEQLLGLPEITSKVLNPSGVFDAIGFSQGGQLLRAVVERCGGKVGLNVRNLITLGSQHMGINAMPPCPPGSSPFSACRLMHSTLLRNGLYSGFAQNNIIPAQYFRDEAKIDTYLEVNTFLKDINNERFGDDEIGPMPDDPTLCPASKKAGEDNEPRNATYAENLSSLNKLVLLRFNQDVTVVPPQSAHFTLPSPSATNCPFPPDPNDLACYLDPVPYEDLPLYGQDYIGLKKLDKKGGLVLGECVGQHMEISNACWEQVVSWLGAGKGEATALQFQG